MHITQGYRRDHRPDLTHVMLAVMIEHQAGMPVLMQPLSGHSRDAHDFGTVISAPIDQWPTTYGTTSLVADRARYSANNLQKLAPTRMQWLPRVPATVNAARTALAHAVPQAMASRKAGSRYHALPSTYGGMEQRWGLISSAPRQPQAQRTVDKQRRTQRDQAGTAWEK